MKFTYVVLIYRYYRLRLGLICTSIFHLVSGWTDKRRLGVWSCCGVRVSRTIQP